MTKVYVIYKECGGHFSGNSVPLAAFSKEEDAIEYSNKSYYYFYEELVLDEKVIRATSGTE